MELKELQGRKTKLWKLNCKRIRHALWHALYQDWGQMLVLLFLIGSLDLVRLGPAGSGWVRLGPAGSGWVRLGPAGSGWVRGLFSRAVWPLPGTFQFFSDCLDSRTRCDQIRPVSGLFPSPSSSLQKTSRGKRTVQIVENTRLSPCSGLS